MASMTAPAAQLKKRVSSREKGRSDNYKFTVCPGNNSRVLLNAFRTRPWLQTFSAQKATASSKGSQYECPGVIWEMYRNPKRYKQPKMSPRTSSNAVDNGKETKNSTTSSFIQANVCVLNHFERDYVLVSKHGLYWSLKAYFYEKGEDIPDWLPETYHVGCESEISEAKHMKEWEYFVDAFNRHEKQVRVPSGGSGDATIDVLLDGSNAMNQQETSNRPNANEGTKASDKLPDIFQAEESSNNGVSSSNSKNNDDKDGLKFENLGISDVFPEVRQRSREKNTKNRRKSGKKKASSSLRKSDVMTNVWIAKPASLSNRGIGIKVVISVEQVKELLEGIKERTRAGYIVQKYIERPFLIHGRKFDIRVFLLLKAGPRSSKLQAYFYQDGYVRTSSFAYSLSAKNQSNSQIHLTNDGIQCKNEAEYGKYEAGNKLNYAEFQEYIDKYHSRGESGGGVSRQKWVENVMVPEMEEILRISVLSVVNTINPKKRKNCFELLGCDFMVTDDFKLKLIEINSNPCLEFSSPYLELFIPKLIEDTFQLTIDEYFPPPKAISDLNTDTLTKPQEQQNQEVASKIKKKRDSFNGGSSIPVPLTKATLAAIDSIQEARTKNRFRLLFQEER